MIYVFYAFIRSPGGLLAVRFYAVGLMALKYYSLLKGKIIGIFYPITGFRCQL